MKLLKDLLEAKLILNKNKFHSYSIQEILDMTFLTLNALVILYNEQDTKRYAVAYIAKTLSNQNFKNFSNAQTDLSNLIYAITKSDDDLFKTSSTKSIEELDPSMVSVKRLFYLMNNNLLSTSQIRRLLYKIQKDFDISTSNYKSIRTIVGEWATKDLSMEQRKLAFTRLLQALKNKALQIDIMPALKNLATSKRYELQDVCDPESGKNCSYKLDLLPLLAVAGLNLSSTYRIMGALKK